MTEQNKDLSTIFPPAICTLPKANIPIDGCTAYLAQETNNQILYMYFEKDVMLPEHSHKAQWGIVLEGQIELTANGHTKTYQKGDRYYIPENTVHSGRIFAGYADMTFFNEAHRYQAIH